MRSRLPYACLVALLTTTAISQAADFDVTFRVSPHTFGTKFAPIVVPPVVVPPTQPVVTDPLALSSSGSSAVVAYGQQFSLVFSATGGKKPYAFSILPTSLPSGMSAFETPDVSLELRGKAPANTYGPYSVTVTDAEGTTKTLSTGSFVVSQPTSPLAFGSAQTAYRFAKGSAWSVNFPATGGAGPYAFSIPSMVPSAAMGTTSVLVSGTGAVGVFSIPVMTATDVVGATDGSDAVTVTVGSDGTLTAYNGAASVNSVSGLNVTPTAAVAKSLRIENTGDFAMTTATVPTVDGPFQIVAAGTTCGSVAMAPGASCTVAVKGIATSDDGLFGTLRLAGRASTIGLSGTAYGFSPNLAVSPTSASDVSIVNGSSPGASTSILVSNTGGTATGILSIVFSQATNDFTVTGGSCVSGTTDLAPGGTCTVLVARKATANDTGRSATLVVSNADGLESSVAVSGSAGGF